MSVIHHDPRVDEDGFFTLDIDAMFERYMAANQKTWQHDRTKSVGASEIFSCMRGLFFKKRGKEFGFHKDADFTERWGATERGNIIEQHFVAPALTTQCPEGVTLEWAGSDQVTLIKGRSSSTPDGLFTGLPKAPLRIRAGGQDIELPDFGSDCLGLEIKSIDPRATLNEERVKHRGQSQVGMGLVRDETEWKPTHWIILYFDASFLDNIKPFIVEWDERVYKAAKRRAPAIWEHDDPNAFEPEGKYTGECDHCPFATACGEAVFSEIKHLDVHENSSPEAIEAVASPVEEYLAAQAAVKDAELAFEQAKQAVKDAMVGAGVRKVRSDAWLASWVTQKGRVTCDYKKAFKDYKIDPAAYEKEGNPIEFIKITPKKEDKA